MLKYRILTGSLLIAGLLGFVWLDASLDGTGHRLDSGGLLALLCAVLIIPLLARETCHLVRSAGGAPSLVVTIVGSILLALSMWRSGDGAMAVPATIMAAVLMLGFAAGMRNRDPKGSILAASSTLLATGYSGGLLGFWLLLRSEHGAWVVLGAILTVKMADIGAFTVGCSIGRRRLIPWLSPKKSWEGLLGGILAAMVLGGVLAHFSSHLAEGDRYDIVTGAVFGGAAAILGLFGDLIGSAMKRDAGVKDSGAILPGLGGVIDTLDSLLVVGPLAWWMLA